MKAIECGLFRYTGFDDTPPETVWDFVEAVLTAFAPVIFFLLVMVVMVGALVYLVAMSYMGAKGMFGVMVKCNKPIKIQYDPRQVDALRKEHERYLNELDKRRMADGGGADGSEYHLEDGGDIDLEYRRMGSS